MFHNPWSFYFIEHNVIILGSLQEVSRISNYVYHMMSIFIIYLDLRREGRGGGCLTKLLMLTSYS